MNPEECDLVRAWLEADVGDSDAMLDRRMDNHGDEWGRTREALRLRLDLARLTPHSATGSRVLFDARSLQTPAFGTRGIGRFASAALAAVRDSVDDRDLTLLVDPALEPLPASLAGSAQQVARLTDEEAMRFRVVVQPSPMTASARPLLPVLSTDAHRIAIVFDFIPAHYPTVYLRHPAARAEYAAALDALALYDEYLCISHATENELRGLRGGGVTQGSSMSVVWPETVDIPASQATETRDSRTRGPIVVMTGDEPRKNTFGALAAIGAATVGEERDVRVVGMAGHDVRVHHWAVGAALRPGEAQTVPRIADEEMLDLLRNASLVVVASFDEGLSLPVLEALACGVPVVASDIPAHRELIGAGSYLAPASDLRALAEAIRTHRGRHQTRDRQVAIARGHRHSSLESTLTAAVTAHLRKHPKPVITTSPSTTPTNRLRIGIATPWPPQRTGVADFSHATVRELANLADVTVYTTVDAHVDDAIAHRSVEYLAGNSHDHDVLVVVAGNSHFHLPHVDLLNNHDCIVIAHDTRMVEYYMALRSKAGAEQVMLRGQHGRTLVPSLDEQIDDMRLLQNAGFWELARSASSLILHSSTAAARIAAETGINPHVLPFANQRVPAEPSLNEELRQAARERLGFDPSLIHIATFGYVDIRTKLTDVVVESAAWLSQWGHRIALHVVGAATPDQARALTRRARIARIDHFEITGYTSEEVFRDYLLAVDLGVQLRISPLLGVSGPLSDLAAFGTPAVASRGLATDIGAPEYVTRLPDDVSSLMVAETIEQALEHPMAPHEREARRVFYLSEHTPRVYAQQLLALLREHLTNRSVAQ
jgi:glycosyltransferase involved in cell wall biosynthesis